MEREFPGSYPPADDVLVGLFQQATIAFDANVLLHIYRYSSEARDQLLDGLQNTADRKQLWVPYQSLVEFHRHRMAVIRDHDALFRDVPDAFSEVGRRLDKIKRRGQGEWGHPYIDIRTLESVADKAKSEADALLRRVKGDRIDPLRDHLLKRLTEIIGDHFGAEPAQEQLAERTELWTRRSELKIPPGYEDSTKVDGGVGDYLIWCELLSHGKESAKPIVFVTDDDKGDWWEKYDKFGRGIESVLPRNELVNEMQCLAGVQYFQLHPKDFLSYAHQHLNLEVSDEVFKEVESVSRAINELETKRRAAISSFQAAAAAMAIDPSTLRAIQQLQRQAAAATNLIDWREQRKLFREADSAFIRAFGGGYDSDPGLTSRNPPYDDLDTSTAERAVEADDQQRDPVFNEEE